MLALLGKLFGPLTDIAGAALARYQERQAARQASTLRIEEAKTAAQVESLKRSQEGELSWDSIMANGSITSWKDEWFVLLFSFPLIGAFVPALQDAVLRGFAILEKMPDWYMASLGLAVAASFGFRGVMQYFQRKR